MGRDKPLKIFGPEAAKDMADHIIKAYQPDIDYRIMVHNHTMIKAIKLFLLLLKKV